MVSAMIDPLMSQVQQVQSCAEWQCYAFPIKGWLSVVESTTTGYAWQ